MTLVKAMQVSRQILDGKELPSYADRNAAIAIGFEAMQRVQSLRGWSPEVAVMLLPSETRE